MPAFRRRPIFLAPRRTPNRLRAFFKVCAGPEGFTIVSAAPASFLMVMRLWSLRPAACAGKVRDPGVFGEPVAFLEEAIEGLEQFLHGAPVGRGADTTPHDICPSWSGPPPDRSVGRHREKPKIACFRIADHDEPGLSPFQKEPLQDAPLQGVGYPGIHRPMAYRKRLAQGSDQYAGARTLGMERLVDVDDQIIEN